MAQSASDMAPVRVLLFLTWPGYGRVQTNLWISLCLGSHVCGSTWDNVQVCV